LFSTVRRITVRYRKYGQNRSSTACLHKPDKDIPAPTYRLDMGTCDELSLDVLINSFMGFSRDLAGLKRIVVGGANSDWPLPDSPDDEDSEGQVGD